MMKNEKLMRAIARTALAGSLYTAAHALAVPTLEKGVIQVGTDFTYPPYAYFDDKRQPAGMDIELMNLIAQKAGLKVRYVDTRFESLIIGVKSNKFDVIASTLYVKPDRAQQVLFIPYMKTVVSMAVRGDSAFRPTKVQQLCGHKVGSIQGAPWIADLKKFSKTFCGAAGAIDSREYPTSAEATLAVMSGDVDAQMGDSAVLFAASRATNGRVVISTYESLYPGVVGLALNPENKELASIINDALDKVRESGAYLKLLTKYYVSAPSASDFKGAITP